jgi:hypothetical protein
MSFVKTPTARGVTSGGESREDIPRTAERTARESVLGVWKRDMRKLLSAVTVGAALGGFLSQWLLGAALLLMFDPVRMHADTISDTLTVSDTLLGFRLSATIMDGQEPGGTARVFFPGVSRAFGGALPNTGDDVLTISGFGVTLTSDADTGLLDAGELASTRFRIMAASDGEAGGFLSDALNACGQVASILSTDTEPKTIPIVCTLAAPPLSETGSTKPSDTLTIDPFSVTLFSGGDPVTEPGGAESLSDTFTISVISCSTCALPVPEPTSVSGFTAVSRGLKRRKQGAFELLRERVRSRRNQQRRSPTT